MPRLGYFEIPVGRTTGPHTTSCRPHVGDGHDRSQGPARWTPQEVFVGSTGERIEASSQADVAYDYSYRANCAGSAQDTEPPPVGVLPEAVPLKLELRDTSPMLIPRPWRPYRKDNRGKCEYSVSSHSRARTMRWTTRPPNHRCGHPATLGAKQPPRDVCLPPEGARGVAALVVHPCRRACTAIGR